MADRIEDTAEFTPKFDASGLIPVIVEDAGGVLMFAHMNSEALALTRATGLVHFWSRSREKIWKKGETSGETLKVRSIRTDCDQDVLLVTVEIQGRGAVCHTGRRSCFYRTLERDRLSPTGGDPLFDPAGVYKT
jgi:phosphoribosyl-AMP cyclohydrolase